MLGQNGHKRPRIDYSVFRTDVARLQQNLDDLETDLKQHSMQVQQKLALILRALDDTPVQGSTPSCMGTDLAAAMDANLADPSSLGLKESHDAAQHAVRVAQNGPLEPDVRGAAGILLSSTEPQSLGTGTGAEGGAGAGSAGAGGSRDLAAAYFAAAESSGFGDRKGVVEGHNLPSGGPLNFNTSLPFSTSLPSGFAASLIAPSGGGRLNLAAGVEGGDEAVANSGSRWCDGWGALPTPDDRGSAASYALPRAELLPPRSASRHAVPGLRLIGSS